MPVPIPSSQPNETIHRVNAMKRLFFSSLSALLMVALTLPSQSFASTTTMHDQPVEKTGSNFVQKSNGAIPYLRTEQKPKQVKTTTPVAIHSTNENSVQMMSQASLAEGGNTVDSDETCQPATDAELVIEQQGWLGDTHFPAIYNVTLHQEDAR